MFQYQVMSEQEAMSERFHLLKEGIYNAVVTKSIDTQSASSGNPMMDMTVSVYDENGLAHDIRDFLVFTPSMMWRVIHFANSADLMTEYESGKLCSDCVIERSVKVKVIVEQGSEIPQDKLKGKQPGSKYPDKNKIDDYIKKDDVRTKNRASFDDDDIPFL
jgi:hypothetical protein